MNGRITEDEVLLGNTSKKICNELSNFIVKEGYAPTQKELGERMGLSRALVKYHLGRLSLAGLIKMTPNKIRGIELNGT